MIGEGVPNGSISVRFVYIVHTALIYRFTCDKVCTLCCIGLYRTST